MTQGYTQNVLDWNIIALSPIIGSQPPACGQMRGVIGPWRFSKVELDEERHLHVVVEVL